MFTVVKSLTGYAVQMENDLVLPGEEVVFKHKRYPIALAWALSRAGL